MKRPRKRPRGFGAVYKRDRVWWIRPPGGKHESSGSPRKEDAENLLQRRLDESRSGRPTLNVGRARYEDLERMLLDDMRANQRRSVGNVERNLLPRLRGFFGGMRAGDISYDVVSAYIARRLEQVSPATVRYERAVLRRMLNIGFRAGKVDRVPPLPAISVSNTRTGFANPEEIERVIHHLPADVKPVVRTLYVTGWRSNEVLGLEWRRVDFATGEIRLDSADTKSGKPRIFPFADLAILAGLLHEQRERTSAFEKASGRICPWVFHVRGERIKCFRTGWRRAVKVAGVPGLTPHDLRRSAARNLVRAGVSEKVVMDLCGWKTRSMFDRYNVTATEDLVEGVARLGDFLNRGRGKVEKAGGDPA